MAKSGNTKVKRASVVAVANYAIGGATFVLLTGFIGRYLTTSEQGFYYTFVSLLAAQWIFELGFTASLLRVAGSEMGYLRVDSGAIVGPEDRVLRLYAIIRGSSRWTILIAGILLVVGIAAGFFLFRSQDSDVAWRGPWILCVVGCAASLVVNNLLAVAQAMNEIVAFNAIRLAGTCCRLLAQAALLLLGAGLWSLAAALILATAVQWLLLHRSYGQIFRRAREGRGGTFDWAREFMPLQWRTAVSSASGYVVFSLPTTLVMAQAGPALAGRYGMSLSILQGFCQMVMGLGAVLAPTLVQYAATGRYHELHQAWKRVTLQMVACMMLIVGIIMAALLLVLPAIENPWTARILGPVEVFLIALTQLASLLVSAFALYLRSFVEETLMMASVATALLVTAAFLTMLPTVGLRAALIGQAAAVFVQVVIAGRLFRKKREDVFRPL